MRNLLFIKALSYKDSYVGQELMMQLDKSVFLDGNWCCFTKDQMLNEVTFNMTLDNMVYSINNYIISKQFDNIIVGWKFESDEVIEFLIKHLNITNEQITIVNLTETEQLNEPNFQLKNKVYKSDYHKIDDSDVLVRVINVDTTDLSGFATAHIISQNI